MKSIYIKPLMIFTSGALLTASIFFSSFKPAKAVTSTVSGEFGCLINKNFAGWDNSLNPVGTNTVNLLIYTNFDNGTFQAFTNNTDNFNGINTTVSSTSQLSGTVASASGPITNSKVLSFTYTQGGGGTFSALVIVSNSGNTLLLTYPYNNPNAEPASGVCQKL